MNNTATFDKLRQLKLYGMERAFQGIVETRHEVALTIDELMAHLVESEWSERQNRKTKRLTKAAGFRSRSAFCEIDFTVQRGLDRTTLMRLSDCSWIDVGKSLIITGPTGVGKSFVSQAIGAQACALGYRTLYYNCSKLFHALRERRVEGTYQRMIARIGKTPLLILDDFGLAVMDVQDRLALLEIIEDRYGRSSTIITSQIPVAQWFDVIGDATIADAICDRLVPEATRFLLSGISLRARQGNTVANEPKNACAKPATTVDSI